MIARSARNWVVWASRNGWCRRSANSAWASSSRSAAATSPSSSRSVNRHRLADTASSSSLASKRQGPALRRVGEALLEVVRSPLGVPSAVDRHRQGRRVAQPPGHRHGLLAQLEAATVEIGPVEGHRQAGEQPHSHLRVARREGGDRFLEEGDERLVAAAAEVVAGDAGVADRRLGQPIAEPELAGERRRLEVRGPPGAGVAAAGPRGTEGEQQVAAPDRLTVARRHERVERSPEVHSRLVVGRLGHRPLAGASRVLDRSASIAARTDRQQEVMGELGEVRVEIAAMRLFEGGADAPVQLGPPARFELAIQRVADEDVLERERARDAATLTRIVPRLTASSSRSTRTSWAALDDHAEHGQGERPPDHGGDAQQLACLVVEIGEPRPGRVANARWQAAAERRHPARRHRVSRGAAAPRRRAGG